MKRENDTLTDDSTFHLPKIELKFVFLPTLLADGINMDIRDVYNQTVCQPINSDVRDFVNW